MQLLLNGILNLINWTKTFKPAFLSSVPQTMLRRSLQSSIVRPSANLEVTIYPEQRLDQVEDSLIEQGFEPFDVQIAIQTKNYREHPVMEFIPLDGDLEGYIAPETFAVNQFNADSAEDVIRGIFGYFH